MTTGDFDAEGHGGDAHQVSKLSDETTPLLGENPASTSQPLEIVPGYEELEGDSPPEFQPYRAKYVTTSNGDIYSHDHHLNEDGEALYQFLLSQAKFPPRYRLDCRGTHSETRVRQVTGTECVNGQYVTVTKAETYTETVVDFDFSIDITQHLRQFSPIVWTAPDDEPTYRGRTKREVLTDTMGGVRRVSRRILKAGKAWREKRIRWGLPPWLSMADEPQTARKPTPAEESMPTRSELSLREWADRYCASRKCMKSFKFRKVPYGWNIEALIPVVKATIARVLHVPSPSISVVFVKSGDEIDIRPSSILSRALSKTWVKVLLWFFLIYPFIWLFRRFRCGRWEVAGSAFPIRTWKHCEGSVPGESAESYRLRTLKESAGGSRRSPNQKSVDFDDRMLAETPNGVSEYVGISERDWFITWEPTIIYCVTSRVQQSTIITAPYRVHSSANNLPQ